MSGHDSATILMHDAWIRSTNVGCQPLLVASTPRANIQQRQAIIFVIGRARSTH
jgi:hypothetical protein